MGGSRGAGGPASLFSAKSILFSTLYTMSEKDCFEIEFGFYSCRNPRSFWKCWGCMRVCVNRNRGRYCFLFCKGPILNDIRGHSDPKKYMPDCRKSHLLFQKFLGRPRRRSRPRRSVGALPPTGPPLSKISGSAPVGHFIPNTL